jgi:hypothetical protein
MARTVRLEWRGPYNLDGREGQSVFTAPDAGRCGIYLVAVEACGQLRAEYVGETGRSFLVRLTEHTCNYLGGLYRIWDPKRLALGEKVPLWGGLWKKDHKDRMPAFLAGHQKYSADARELLRLHRISLAPVDLEKRERQRVEAALVVEISRRDAGREHLLDGDLRTLRRRKGEEAMDLIVAWPAELAYLQGKLAA